MRVALVNPNLVAQRHDLFTTGIVYMPVGLASFAGVLRARGYELVVVDAFGSAPNQFWEERGLLFRGLTPEEVAGKIGADVDVVIVYAINLSAHESVLELLRALRRALPQASLAVMENTQAVTAYAIEVVKDELVAAGADVLLAGEIEKRGLDWLQGLATGEQGGGLTTIGRSAPAGPPADKGGVSAEKQDLDALPFPAWDLFPLAGYWGLPHAHGPRFDTKYLAILTSRGCPYPCRFCVIPKTNGRTWRGASAVRVVDEMEHFGHTLGVREFHLEDVDPTVSNTRTLAICDELDRRDLKVRFRLVSGTKVETLKSSETIRRLAQAGCDYISISPESGSARVMKLINKPFDAELAVELVGTMNAVGIRSQACFVLGFPGEQDEDRAMTQALIERLTRAGLDEIAIFIITPVPGSEIFEQFSGYRSLSELNFSPSWREDYALLNRWRLRLYRRFLQLKVTHFPRKVAKQPLLFLRRRFETKMEMAPVRALHAALLVRGIGGHRVQRNPRLATER